MNTTQTLTSIALIGTLALTTGCGKDYSIYDYNGLIGQDSVRFESSSVNNIKIAYNRSCNGLTIKKPDGRVIVYADSFYNNLAIESIKVTQNDSTMVYKSTDKIGTMVLQRGQEQFDTYLRLILDIKKDKALKLIE